MGNIRDLIVTGLLICGLQAPAQGQTGNAPSDLAGEKAGDDQTNKNITRWARGRIDYLTLDTGAPKGSEAFYLTVHPDGTRTMHATTDIYARDVHANVTFRADQRGRPLEAFVLMHTQGRFKGSSHFSVGADQLRLTHQGPTGQVSQSLKIPDAFALITHPVSLDGWHLWHVERKKRRDQEGTIYLLNGSPDFSRPLMGSLRPQTYRYLGQERITVPAGTFETSHYRMGGDSDVWVWGPDRLLVQYIWKSFNRRYVLGEIEQG